MGAQVRAAGVAALLVFLAFAVHAANMFYFEPRMGFSRLADYASFPKLAVGLRSQSWLWSGYAHFVCGLALAVLAAVGSRLFEPRRPLGARLVLLTGALACGPFLLTGGCDITGRTLRELLDQANPGNGDALYGALTLLRGVANNLAIVLAGWFTLHFTWCLRQTGKVGFLLGLLGYLTGAVAFAAFLWPAGYGLAYLLLPGWTGWLGLEFLSNAPQIATEEDL